MELKVLQADMVLAMKAKEKLRKETISSIISAVKKTAIDEKCKDNITPELVDRVILKEQKTVKEMIDTCPKEREDLMNQYLIKYSIISEYAPKLIVCESEIETFVRNLCFDGDLPLIKQNRGKIMGMLKGKVDMKIANKVVAGILE